MSDDAKLAGQLRLAPETDAAESSAAARDWDRPLRLPPDETARKIPTADASAEQGSATAEGNAAALLASSVRRNRAGFRCFLGVAGVLLLFAIGLDTYGFVRDQYRDHPLLGLTALVLVTAVVAAAAGLLATELRNLRRLKAIASLREQGSGLLARGGAGEAASYLGAVSALYAERSDLQPGLGAFATLSHEYHDDRDLIRIFSDRVIQPLDERAYAIVVRYAREAALMTALSPMALLAAVLMLWRNVHMIREIAALYGGRPGLSASLVLTRDVLAGVAFAGASDVLADSTAEVLGGSLVSLFSAQVAQGIGNGVMTARIGLRVIQLCRPLPFAENERPRFRRVWREVLRGLKQTLGGPERPQEGVRGA
jgi:putative membrane protein